MKNKTIKGNILKRNILWYFGYAVTLGLILLIVLTDFPEKIDLALTVLLVVVFSISHTNILYNRMMRRDADFRVDVMDERNISIREKSGNIGNMVNISLLGLATVIFIAFDYVFPAIVTGIIVAVQPVILIFISRAIEKRM